MTHLSSVEPAGLHAPCGYSHAVLTNGPLVHVAGQVALGPDGALVGLGDFGAQAERALANVDLALAGAGSTFAAVASLTIYVTAHVPRDHLAALRDPLRRRIGSGRPPAITLAFVHALIEPDWLIEVQAVAVAEGSANSAVPARHSQLDGPI